MAVTGRNSGQFGNRNSLGRQPLSNVHGGLQKLLRRRRIAAESSERTRPFQPIDPYSEPGVVTRTITRFVEESVPVFFKQAPFFAKVSDGTGQTFDRLAERCTDLAMAEEAFQF